MGRPKKLQPLNVKLNVMLTEQMFECLFELAKREEINPSAMVRALIAREAQRVLGRSGR
jgi:hypothetical protein